MAFANSVKSNSNVSPIEKFLELKKGVFSCWNKDVELNEVHNLNNFIILDIVYTIKGAEWNDTLKKYTNRYFSNEIRNFNESLYLVKMQFANGQTIKDLVIKGNWKKDIKPVLPQGASLNIGLVIYDLNDKKIKEVFLSGNNFYKVSQFIKNVNSNNVIEFITGVGYTNGTKDKEGNELIVDEAFVDSLKGTEAAKYQKRYLLDIKDTGRLFENNDDINGMAEILDEAYNEKKKYYINTYELGKIVELEEGEFYKPTEEQLGVEDVTAMFDPNADSVEEIKRLGVPF